MEHKVDLLMQILQSSATPVPSLLLPSLTQVRTRTLYLLPAAP